MQKLNLYGSDLFGKEIKPESRGVVSDRFVFPPFSVLDSKNKHWQIRKKKWLSFGIKGELGRSAKTYNCYDWIETKRKEQGNIKGFIHGDGVSIFDPVLCELMYGWFCLEGGQILDPFAGGSVRGIVASLLDYNYWGCDLSKEQIKENKKQGKMICNKQPVWFSGNSIKKIHNAPIADFIFSCPPYGYLEKYSNDPQDLSNMDYDSFIIAYSKIIKLSCKKLKNNRFACFVVSDFRDKKGMYNNFVSDTIDIFLKQGLYLYNEIIFLTSPGSAAMRVTKQFDASRKTAKTHQNVLVFVKGNPKKATKSIKE